MELLYSTSMGTTSMVLVALLIYICFGFIFIGNIRLLSVAKNNLRPEYDAFGFFGAGVEIYSYTTFMNILVCLIMQPVIYIVMFTTYGLEVLDYAKFMIILLGSIVMERLFFANLLFQSKNKISETHLLIHTVILGLVITSIITYYFRSTGL